MMVAMRLVVIIHLSYGALLALRAPHPRRHTHLASPINFPGLYFRRRESGGEDRSGTRHVLGPRSWILGPRTIPRNILASQGANLLLDRGLRWGDVSHDSVSHGRGVLLADFGRLRCERRDIRGRDAVGRRCSRGCTSRGDSHDRATRGQVDSRDGATRGQRALLAFFDGPARLTAAFTSNGDNCTVDHDMRRRTLAEDRSPGVHAHMFAAFESMGFLEYVPARGPDAVHTAWAVASLLSSFLSRESWESSLKAVVWDNHATQEVPVLHSCGGHLGLRWEARLETYLRWVCPAS